MFFFNNFHVSSLILRYILNVCVQEERCRFNLPVFMSLSNFVRFVKDVVFSTVRIFFHFALKKNRKLSLSIYLWFSILVISMTVCVPAPWCFYGDSIAFLNRIWERCSLTRSRKDALVLHLLCLCFHKHFRNCFSSSLDIVTGTFIELWLYTACVWLAISILILLIRGHRQSFQFSK